ncbi:MAG: hypothetical protein RLZZ488_2426 [Pseudomonadota bacterium]|jgi:hypothetical protein
MLLHSLLLSAVILTGCGSSGDDKFVNLPTGAPEQKKTTPNSGSTSTSDVGGKPAEPTGIPLQPVPVLGSYLVASLDNPANIPLDGAQLRITESGSVFATVLGVWSFYQLPVVDVFKVSSLSVVRQSGELVAERILTVDEQRMLEPAVVKANEILQARFVVRLAVPAVGNLLGISVVDQQVSPFADNILKSDPVAQTDVTPPLIQGISKVDESLQTEVVIINASDSGVGLHELAYSFDSGATWQQSNKKSFKLRTTLAPGSLKVRDKAGNESAYEFGVYIE